MEITWLGHSCFRIRGRGATLVTDPYSETVGYMWPDPTADIVTISHGHDGHNDSSRINGDAKIVSRPGEYEIKEVLITGLPGFHDSEQGNLRGKNIMYLIEMEEVTFCHLGDLGHLPSSRQVEELSNTDVLFVPVGGISTTDARMASQIVRLLSPKVVIPMHYQTDVVTWLEPLDKFVKEMGLREVLPQPRISITKSNLPAETQVTVLDYPHQPT
ncbi:MAG: MBL fold metallo-hydrolase [Chloroflexi bacterium]|nr:MBL fold metallo-hydrolase [Chloroflexota bacterium]